jgi:hypothetical protein
VVVGLLADIVAVRVVLVTELDDIHLRRGILIRVNPRYPAQIIIFGPIGDTRRAVLTQHSTAQPSALLLVGLVVKFY